MLEGVFAELRVLYKSSQRCCFVRGVGVSFLKRLSKKLADDMGINNVVIIRAMKSLFIDMRLLSALINLCIAGIPAD